MNNCLITITLNRDEMNLIVAGLSVGIANADADISETDMLKKWGLPSCEVARHIKKKSHTFMISRYTLRRWCIGVLNGMDFLHLSDRGPVILLLQKMQHILYGFDENMGV